MCRDLKSWIIVGIILVICMSYPGLTLAEFHPVRIWGDLTALYRERDFNAGKNHATDWQAITTVNASSYIWQPWLALVDGSLSYSADKEQYTDQAPTRDQYINGNFRLNLFPSSRFPFLLYASKSQNELDDEDFGRTIENTVYGMRQQYSSLDGLEFYSGNIERSIRDDVDQESFVNNNLGFTSRFKMQNNILYGDIDYSNIEKPNKDDEVNYAITGRHSFTRKSNFTLENIISTAQSHYDFINNSSDTQNDQVSSFLSWRPANRSDLNFSANLRLSNLAQSFRQYAENVPDDEETSFEQGLININQSLIYNYSNNVTFSETINGTETETGNTVQFTGSESLGFGYGSDSFDTSIGYYSWNAGVNINRQHGDVIETERDVNNQLGHSLAKIIQVTPGINLQSSFNQSAEYKFRENQEDASDLNHSITMNWSESSFTESTSVRFMLADSRNNDIVDNKFQMLNLQVSQDYRISRHTHLIANFTIQGTRVSSNQELTETQLVDGQFNYYNSRFLNVHGLGFKSELILNFRKTTDRGEDIINANDDLDHDNSWRNEIVYRIGLFESRLNLDYVKNDDKYDRVIKVQLTRNFGDL